jgi:hypothetical protein
MPHARGQIRIIAFITHSADIRKILDYIGVDAEPPHISPARGPPMWDDCDAQMDDGVQIAQTGIWQNNRPPITRWTSASIGD